MLLLLLKLKLLLLLLNFDLLLLLLLLLLQIKPPLCELRLHLRDGTAVVKRFEVTLTCGGVAA